jgi:hypothetical protein
MDLGIGAHSPVSRLNECLDAYGLDDLTDLGDLPAYCLRDFCFLLLFPYCWFAISPLFLLHFGLFHS